MVQCLEILLKAQLGVDVSASKTESFSQKVTIPAGKWWRVYAAGAGEKIDFDIYRPYFLKPGRYKDGSGYVINYTGISWKAESN
ncbi:hypothetical protein [Caldicellulosiruptor naganoensis]|uniref:Uncharacterized protein n=1 Tax=Caldicellulosiruptor naganoensis TaxID=29324 RepID=A0ABY7BFE0_9FIRM|nr:hypothetical protein [Caldicellulosiruptor naganoensis]WAM31523.1 hypothetical protein OTJ99_002412 [Caldicellulosiruptor naganoensis]